MDVAMHEETRGLDIQLRADVFANLDEVLAALPPTISILQPPGLKSRMTLPAAGVSMLTGTRVSDDVAATAACFSLRRQR
jgi:hypothetical protein